MIGVMDVFTSTSTRWIYDRSFQTIRQLIEDQEVKTDVELTTALEQYASQFDKDVRDMMARGILAAVFFDQ